MKDWIAKLLSVHDLTRMGHMQRVEDANLGLGWIYYALARVIRPKQVVVIGSYRGFVPLVLGKALADNMGGGRVTFLDPSFVDDFWKDAESVRAHFASFEVTNVDHFLMTTQQFTVSTAYRALDGLGMVFIDGYHTVEQARYDYEAFANLLLPDGVILLHDTSQCKISGIYGEGRAYECRVKCFVDDLKHEPRLQVFDLPFGQGVTLVRKTGEREYDARDASSFAPITAANGKP